MSERPKPPRPSSIPPASVRPPARSTRKGRLAGRRIALGVTGSIAAYKAAILARLLVKDGAEVQVVLTHAAREFIGAATFAGITGNPVLDDMFDENLGGEVHVDLAQDSDLVVVMPTTADALARFAQGRAGDVLSACLLCATSPVLLVPAMHPRMWSHPATKRNVATLTGDGRVLFVGPESGEVASGESGVGRMAEPETVHAAILAQLSHDGLAGKHLVITAGPTVEDLDPVRFISNRSTGKMGFALAERAAQRGAHVTLISGPVELPTPYGVHRVDVRSAVAMRGAVWQAVGPDLKHADGLIMCAAVGDYRPAESHSSKLKRGEGGLGLELVQNPDIISEVGAARQGKRPVLVAFAVETAPPDVIVENARGKLQKKRVDLVVANHAKDSFGKTDNVATLVGPVDALPLPQMLKLELADRILDWVLARLSENPQA
ncbi:MAG: bifunctional phosphopantothenoylcysteine decarboxylase/phosphopantothenate--cysteine ligase CoaBC [Polyangiaceae bacterium]|nr:bifunctional phosphopantothenoylcysteine decarboxylase/phosphopantothenate--cysteine ligase CoaBC [Polyangiaceae bacterium]